MSAAIDSVLIVGFGGPTRPDEIRPFLDNVLRGRPVPPERYEAVVHHYERIGGRSPYNDLTMRQAAALGDALARNGDAIPIEVGMRNSNPYIEDAMRRLVERGARRTLAFIMAAYRSEASWERYQQNVEDARAKLGASATEVEYPAPWHAHPMFIRATSARFAEALARVNLDARERDEVSVIFTAHSIPVAMANASPYVAQLEETARLTAAALGIDNWTLAYQSRSGSPREPWLEPDVLSLLKNLKSSAVVVAPIGFLSDHVEVLYDLDIEAAAVARERGIRFERAPTVGDHPDFIAMMASVVRGHRG
jgi:protoporphyrin/coproporphyrin ferrochelatase